MIAASIIVILRNNRDDLVGFVDSLVNYTPEHLYECVVVDRGSTDGTSEILAGLEGDLTVLVDEASSFGDVVTKAVGLASADVLIVCAPSARFSEDWLPTMLASLRTTSQPCVLTTPTSDVVCIQASTFSAFSGFDGTLSDQIATADLLARISQAGGAVVGAIDQRPAVQTLRPAPPSEPPPLVIPPHLLGYDTGAALSQVMAAGDAGAGIGELPLQAAEALRERFAAEEEWALLQAARRGRDVCWFDENNPEPLVTIRIATYNRADALMDLALPAALRQTYENTEILIVGDNTDEATVKAMKSVTDKRVRFINLPFPTLYPEEPLARWRVGGSPPMNIGIELAKGAWIAPSDDDDEMTDDHVEVLLRAALDRRLELVWSKTNMQTPNGWITVGREPLQAGNLTHGSVLFSSGLRFMRMSTTCWKLYEPQDANFWRRMDQIGVRSGFVDAVTYTYYLSTVFAHQAQSQR